MTERAPAVPGYVHRSIAGAEVLAREPAFQPVEQALESSGTLHGFAAAHPESRALKGRGALHVVPSPTPTADGRWVVRHLTHGGLLAPLTGDLFLRLGTPRPFNELSLAVELSRAGIATPEVVASVVYPAGLFYRGDIARRWIPDAEDLAAVLFGGDGLVVTDRAAALGAAGALVGDLHDVGLFHPDLNARNILIETTPEGLRAHILDLEKCRLEPPLGPHRRETMLKRLRRSLQKFESDSGKRLSDADLEAFREGYA